MGTDRRKRSADDSFVSGGVRCATIKTVKEPATSPEYDAFKTLLNRIASVPRETLQQRETEYRKQSALNPSKPGPKPKRKRASGRAPAV